jgi:hypothetical protein
MYSNPTLFPQISNRESWIQTLQLFDDDTGDLITLTDPTGIYAAYSVVLEIMPPRRHGYGYGGGGYVYSSYQGNVYDRAVIYERLGQGDAAIGSNPVLSIVSNGTISIQVAKSYMERLRHHQTWDVFLTLNDDLNDDGRQILIGRLPVFGGGRNT